MNSIAVIWDLNGVIIDDMQFHFRAFQAYLREIGSDMTEEYFIRNCTGTPPTEVFAAVLPGLGNPVTVEDAIHRKREIYFELTRGNMEMLPGVRALIEDLHRRGIPQAIASGATRLEVETILDEFGIRPLFAAAVACEDVSRGKPDPEPFLTAASLLGADPANCLVIEDGEYGVRAAKTCGMKAIAVTNTQTREQLAAADLVVGSLEEVDSERVWGITASPIGVDSSSKLTAP